MVFEWKKGYRASVKADVAGSVMKRLEEKGDLTPSALVDEARPVESPLHRAFEWNDAKAAEIYRRQQATIMIRSIVVKESAVVSGGSEEVQVRIFNQLERGESYESLHTILVDEEKVDLLLERAKRELEVFRNKYGQLVQLARLMEAIDEILDEEGPMEEAQ
jgi:hypothetical protein